MDVLCAQACQGLRIDALRFGHHDVLELQPHGSEKNANLFLVIRHFLSQNIAFFLHGLQSHKGRGFADPGQITQLALSQTISNPKHTKKGPMAVENTMTFQPLL